MGKPVAPSQETGDAACASLHHVRRGRRATAIYTLIEPQAWLADVLARLQDHQAKRIAELLPWNWKRQRQHKLAA
jgi:hypothetical protein